MTHWQTAYRHTLEEMYAMLPMYQRIGPPAMKKDLGNTLALLEAMGHPERSFTSVHIAGTNGKGSLTHMLGSVFMESGRRTGLYTSPHYRDFRERIKVGDRLIRPSAVLAFMDRYREVIHEIGPSFFEVTVAMAFWYFRETQVDMAVIETGLGGRLDSTNVLQPCLSVITNIGFDHMDLLGGTLPEIAAEKAGIIKPGIPVVIGEEQPETSAVFLEKARQMGASISFAGRHFRVESTRPGSRGQEWLVRSLDTGEEDWMASDLDGPYQARNAVTFLECCRVLTGEGLLSPGAELSVALSRVRTNTRFIGRWQVLRTEPRVLVDSAHNVPGLQALFEGLVLPGSGKLTVIFGTVRDKDLTGILAVLPRSATYVFTQARVPRAMPATELARAAQAVGLSGRVIPKVRNALKSALKSSTPQDLICVCGSIFVVAEVLPAGPGS